MNYTIQPAYLLLVLAALVACSAKDPQAAKSDAAKPLNPRWLIARKLAEIAGQANGAAPAEVDPNTRLDGARAGPGLRLTIQYTLVNSESEGTNSATFESKLTPIIKDGTCKNPDLRPLIDQGSVVVLEYRGGDGKPIGTLNINHATCVALK